MEEEENNSNEAKVHSKDKKMVEEHQLEDIKTKVHGEIVKTAKEEETEQKLEDIGKQVNVDIDKMMKEVLDKTESAKQATDDIGNKKDETEDKGKEKEESSDSSDDEEMTPVIRIEKIESSSDEEEESDDKNDVAEKEKEEAKQDVADRKEESVKNETTAVRQAEEKLEEKVGNVKPESAEEMKSENNDQAAEGKEGTDGDQEPKDPVKEGGNESELQGAFEEELSAKSQASEDCKYLGGGPVIILCPYCEDTIETQTTEVAGKAKCFGLIKGDIYIEHSCGACSKRLMLTLRDDILEAVVVVDTAADQANETIKSIAEVEETKDGVPKKDSNQNDEEIKEDIDNKVNDAIEESKESVSEA